MTRRRWALWIIAASLLFSERGAPLLAGHPVLQAVAASYSTVVCGRERRVVKTLSDSAANRVNLTPVRTTIEALRALPVPAIIEFGTPRLVEEMRTYAVTARLLWSKLEADGDFHVVIAGQSGATMIAEFPDPACTTGSPLRDKIAAARAAFITRFGLPDREVFRRVQGQPTLQLGGVAFFDILHGQRGVAPNGVELHPVLALGSP